MKRHSIPSRHCRVFGFIAAMVQSAGLVLAADSIKIVEAPTLLPRGCPLDEGLTPFMKVEYQAERAGNYEVQLHLLERSTGNYYKGSTQGPWSWKVDSGSVGALSVLEEMDVHDYDRFLIVAVLNRNGQEALRAEVAARGITGRAPSFSGPSKVKGDVGKELSLAVRATSEDHKIEYALVEAAPGIKLTSEGLVFTAPRSGVFRATLAAKDLKTGLVNNRVYSFDTSRSALAAESKPTEEYKLP